MSTTRTLLLAVTCLVNVLSCGGETDIHRRDCIATVRSAILGGTSDGGIWNVGHRAIAYVTVFAESSASSGGSAPTVIGWCSGVVLDDRRVVSAAHCFPSATSQAEVRIPGDGNSSSTPPECSSVDWTTGARRAAVHPTLDAVVLLLDEAIPSATRARIAADLPKPGTRATAAGYGIGDNMAPGHLLFLDTQIVEVGPDVIRTQATGNAGACVGDSGGPLYVVDSHGNEQVVGILTEGSALCNGVDSYVPAAKLREWLDSL